MKGKQLRCKRDMKSVFLLLILIVVCSCGTDSSYNSGPSTTTTTTTTTTTATSPANITLTATPSAIMTVGTSSISATVTTSTGSNVADGTEVKFSVSSSAMGTITSSANTSNGVATATFTALTVPGTVTITATAGSISQTTAVTISAPATGGIEYVSATPQVLGIKGGGQTLSSQVKFSVKDINGNTVVDGTSVSFVMVGPSGGKLPSNGGEYIGDMDTTPTTASASTVSGNVTVFLNSGSVAGPVTIKASVVSESQTLSASSAVISIGGGVPSATHFNIASSRINLPGLAVSNKQATISAYIADRFGNYNVLTGTSVSFYPEAGAIDRSNITDASGITSVTFRTQAPDPAEVAIVPWETTLINTLNTTYLTPAGSLSTAIPTDGSYHPRDGWVTVLATVQGEEAFNDANANGLYDTGESFTDIGEPFYDKNDDGCRNDGSTKNCSGTVSASTDPFEEYIDATGNGSYDGPNGVWDGPECAGTGCLTAKMIWTSITLALTGSASYCSVSPSSFTVTNGGWQSFSFMVGDANTNRLASDTTTTAVTAPTTISVTTSKGTLAGTTSTTIFDGLPYGPTEIGFTLSDADTDTTVDASVITITVSSEEVGGCVVSASGTVQ